MSLALACASCSASSAEASADNTKRNIPEMTASQPDTADVLVDIKTTAGDIRVRLFGDTPRHRDNFVKLVKDGFYNGVLFHRVIDEFMIQTGDPDSKTAPKGAALGSGGPGYQIDAEIVYPRHFHRRGALAAARQGDQVNPRRQSSGSQFYIVTGRASSEAELARMEQQMEMMKKQNIFQELARDRQDEIRRMQMSGDHQGLETLRQRLIAITEEKAAADTAPAMTAEQREAYGTVGGAPHLDGQYTVFGQVESGMDVVDKIEKVATDGRDRPIDDIKIISMSIVE